MALLNQRLFYINKELLASGADPIPGILIVDNCEELYLQVVSPNGGSAGVVFAIVTGITDPPYSISLAEFNALGPRRITLSPGDPMVRFDLGPASSRVGGGSIEVPPFGMVPGSAVYMKQAAVDAQNIFGYVYQRCGIRS